MKSGFRSRGVHIFDDFERTRVPTKNGPGPFGVCFSPIFYFFLAFAHRRCREKVPSKYRSRRGAVRFLSQSIAPVEAQCVF